MEKGMSPLPPGDGFAFNYQPSRLDRNALFAINRCFDKTKVEQARLKYHRAFLNIDDLRNDLLEYAKPKKPRRVAENYYAILESVERDIFGDIKTSVLTHGAVAAHKDLPGHKSPGLPYKLQGFKTKRDVLDDPQNLRKIRAEWYAIERREPVILPDVACYSRAQICSRDKNKIRATWGYPMTVFLTEAQFFYPLMDGIKERDQPLLAYGVEMGNGGMEYVNEMIDHYRGSNYLVGDWSKFDKTVPAWIIRDAFNMCRRHIDFTKVICVEGKAWPVSEAKTKRRWDRMVKYFIDTPIQLSSGERFLKRGGVPSGSCFTNLIDGIVNAIVVRYVVFNLTNQLPRADCYLGDDFIAVTDKPLDMELFSEMAEEMFSMVFNVDKSYQTGNPENVHFLGYYNIHGYPAKPIDTTIVSALYPERPVLSKFETAVRLVGQAYSCFQPDDAKRFFKAAMILRDEIEGLTNEYVEEFIQDHTHWFKYLHTLGIKRSLKVFDVKETDVILITMPKPPRKKWKPRYHDLEELAEAAFARWKRDKE